MHRLVVFLALIVTVLCSNAAAQDSGFGLGFILGEPTGMGAKLWVAKSVAIDGAFAWSFATGDEEKGAFHLHTDCLLHNFEGRLRTYYGIGARIKFGDRFDGERRVGVRVPVGITYLFGRSPWDVFIEILPLIDLAPDTDARINGGIGLRYYFGSQGIESESREYPDLIF